MRTIKGFEGLYSISKLGKVYSHKRSIELSPKIDKNNYEEVGLIKNGKRKYIRVHRLVAAAFIPNPENKPQVNHKDGNPRNNHVDNLEWNTGFENQKHRVEILKRGIKQISQFSMSGELLGVFESIKKAAEATGIDKSFISACASGRYKNNTKHIWI